MSDLISKFVSSNRSGIIPLNITFQNTSVGEYSSCIWDFGDYTQSTIINPSHVYTTDGSFVVTLTILDSLGNQSQSQTLIQAFADNSYAISSSTQQALFTTKRFTTGQVAVRKTIVDGSIISTNFPLSSSTGHFNTSFAGKFVLPIIVSASTGTVKNQLHYTLATYPEVMTYSGGERYVGLFLKSGLTVATTSCSGSQLFMYRVTGAADGTMYLDRQTPYIFNGTTSFPFAAFMLFSSSSTANTMSANSSTQSLLSLPTIDSLETMEMSSMYDINSKASGLLSYFEEDEYCGKTKLYVVPTYSGWNSVETWKPSTVRLSLPYVMWHSKPTAGVNLIDSSNTMIDKHTNLLYSNLTIEDYGTIVGRVFHDKKIIVIDDVELQASLNYLSNRNYTLPAPVVNVTRTSDSWGGLQTGSTYFVTYRVRDDSSYSGAVQYGVSGETQPLHCRYIQQITPSTSGYKLRIQAPASVWRVASRGTANTGFTAQVVDVLIASASTAGTISDAVWYYTGNMGTYANLNSGIEVPFSTGGLMPLASFTGITISGNINFRYGDDPILIGYFSATSQSTIYKMSTTLVARNNEFNRTQNPTYNENLNESVYITEAALYNENNELLMTGKLSTPIEKNDQKFVTIKMELDL